MVGFRVDVKQLIIRFSVWLEEFVHQVECDIEVINLFWVAFNSIFSLCSLK